MSSEALVESLTRPIIGIQNRTAEEAFDIMADRIRAALSALAVSETAGRVQLKLPHADDAADPSSSEVAAQPQPALLHAGDDGWQDIATAPKDGTALLLYVPGVRSWNRKDGIVVGLWENQIGRTSFDGGKTWHSGGWFSDIGDVNEGYESTGAYFQHEWLQPTHWRPLPTPPAKGTPHV